jgi:formylglycine-generating enzyme required for sulfatase activity
MVMNMQTTNKAWQGVGFAMLFLLTTASAQAQVNVPVEQPYKSPPGCHVHFANITVLPRNETNAVIQFDIYWDGSWRHDVNHDAAWVFFKFQTVGAPPKAWRHVRLAADKELNPTGYGQASAGKPLIFEMGQASNSLHKVTAAGDTNFDFLVPCDADGFTGVFVRRADHGMGTASGGKLTVLWNLADCPDIKKDTQVAIKVYGLKMIYVAEGPFYLGTSGDESYAFYQSQPERKQAAEKERIVSATSTMVVREQKDSVQEFPPYLVTNSAAIPTGKQPGKLWARGAEPEDGGVIPAGFPNGYKGFYMMDRPIPQAAYAFFLDSLTPELAAAHYQEEGHPTHGPIRRLGEGPAYSYRFFHGRLKSNSVWWLCWADCAAFADWAGLRPMTELEHEKALRGPRYPVVNEAGHSFWGGSYGGGRYNAHPSEFQVTVANAAGRAYRGTHGSGTATNWPADWPKKDAVGTGVHGGQECASGPPELKGPFWCTSCRIDAALGDPDRFVTYGFRPARTAPDAATTNTVKNLAESSSLLMGMPGSRDE